MTVLEGLVTWKPLTHRSSVRQKRRLRVALTNMGFSIGRITTSPGYSPTRPIYFIPGFLCGPPDTLMKVSNLINLLRLSARQIAFARDRKIALKKGVTSVVVA